MSVVRTIKINDLAPAELAELFCDMDAQRQADFFAAIQPIAATWPGAGWCQQSCSISMAINDRARFVIVKLAEHVLDCENLEGVVAARSEPKS